MEQKFTNLLTQSTTVSQNSISNMSINQTQIQQMVQAQQSQNQSNLSELDPNDYMQILKIFEKYNLKESEDIFKRELNKKISNGSGEDQKERDFYFEVYDSLIKFVDSTREYKNELSQVLFPIFLHLYLDMLNKDLNKLAIEFFDKYSSIQATQHLIDIRQLRSITNKEQLARSEIKETYASVKYNVKLNEESYRLLKEYVKMKNCKQLVELIKENIMLEIYQGPLRDLRQQNISGGGLLGETNSNNNVQKIYYGILKEPDLNLDENEDGEGEENEKPKKRKNKRDAMSNKKNRIDPNAPPINRVPLPELRDIDRQNKQQSMRDFIKRARLGVDKLPSICFYSILNSYNMVNCCDITDDSTWIVLGLADSTVRVCTLSEKQKLKFIKPLHDLESLDKESDDILNMMFDENSATESRTLVGHSGPVYGVSFSPDKYYVVSCSEDGTIRLWCLLTFSCLVSYKGHNGPVWDVKFGPFGHYFASCGMDRTARLWASDQYQCLRLYTDHMADVECICFHPNCNYLATGSSDRSIRIYDIGSLADNPQVRQFTGHKDSINILKFSSCGRFLASGGADSAIFIWDISTSVIVAQLCSHRGSIYAIEFSRDNSVFATGGLDNTIKLWNMAKLVKDVEQVEDLRKFQIKNETNYEIGSWCTKQTPIMHLHFTRRNLLVGLGLFKSSN